MTLDEQWMRRALELAERGRFSTSPNPMVGCVVVRDGAVLGEGFHLRAGLPHAEREALAAARDARGATLYVSLEPCAHHGRTPPCVDAIVEAGIARVVVAMPDPNRAVEGEGAQRLRAAGIRVDVGLLEHDARRLNEKFVVNCERSRPFVLLKAGMTLDARLATIERKSRWITGAAARERSLLLREEYDAIAVGSGTVREDDPMLTRRLGLNTAITPWTRVVLDGQVPVPAGSQVLNDGGRTIIFTPDPDRFQGTTAESVHTASDERGIDLASVFNELWSRGIRSLIVEGGSRLHTSLIEQKLWDKMQLFVAPVLLGGASAPALFGGEGIAELRDAIRFRFDSVEPVGDDLLVTAYPA